MIRSIIGASLLLLLGFPAAAEIAVVVHASNPVQTLSESEVRKLYLGRMRLFPGSRIEVNAYDLDDDSPIRRDFYQTLLDMNATQLSGYRATFLFSGKGRVPDVLDTPEAVIDALRRDPGGIGYLRVTPDDTPVPADVKVVFRLSDNEAR